MHWFVLIDGLLILLLVVTIVCAFNLSRRLASLRSDKRNLENLMEQFKTITDKADASLSGLRTTAEGVVSDLREATESSRAMRDELAFLVERADRVAEKLTSPRDSEEFVNQEEKEYFSSSSGTDDSDESEANIDIAQLNDNSEDDFKSVVEQDLINALRRVK